MLKYPTLFFMSILLTSATASFADEGPEWTYEGKHGPEFWGELEDGYDICRRGQNQSPIDLVSDIDADLPELNLSYTQPGDLAEINTGHAIQERVKPGNYLWFRQTRFELKQFHFHSPSEHTVNGEHYPMEVHLVHQDEDGRYAVIGLLFKEGEHNELMDQLPSFRRERGEDPSGDTVDYNELLPDRSNYFYYNGSLTTPPCTEGVTWAVLKKPVIVSPAQIQHYHDLLGFDNNRPIQPKNSRVVLD